MNGDRAPLLQRAFNGGIALVILVSKLRLGTHFSLQLRCLPRRGPAIAGSPRPLSVEAAAAAPAESLIAVDTTATTGSPQLRR